MFKTSTFYLHYSFSEPNEKCSAQLFANYVSNHLELSFKISSGFPAETTEVAFFFPFQFFFMTEAILVFSPHGSLIKSFSHKAKGGAHWILQGLSASCAVLGLAAISYNKHLNAKPHFTSWHGLLGLLAVCLLGLQSLAAMPLIYHSLAKGWSLAKLKRYHAASGLVTYLLCSVSLLLGLCSAWFTASVKEYTWYLSALCPALSVLVIMNQVTSAYTARKRLQP